MEQVGVSARTKCFVLWWPGTELNRRRQPFQGCSPPKLSIDSAILSIISLPDFVLFNWSQNEAKLYKSEPAEICLNIDSGFGLPAH